MVWLAKDPFNINSASWLYKGSSRANLQKHTARDFCWRVFPGNRESFALESLPSRLKRACEMRNTIALFASLITPVLKLSISVGSFNPKTLADRQTSVVRVSCQDYVRFRACLRSYVRSTMYLTLLFEPSGHADSLENAWKLMGLYVAANFLEISLTHIHLGNGELQSVRSL